MPVQGFRVLASGRGAVLRGSGAWGLKRRRVWGREWAQGCLGLVELGGGGGDFVSGCRVRGLGFSFRVQGRGLGAWGIRPEEP